MSIALTLGGKKFKTKEAAIKYAKTLLHSYDDLFYKPDGYKYRVILKNENYSVMHDILAMHPNIKTKEQGFVNTIKIIGIEKSMGNTHFYYVTIDGHKDSFSYRKCFLSDNSYNRERKVDAFRGLVKQQCIDYKYKRIGTSTYYPCDLSHILCNPSDLQIDHYVPFSNLVNDFMNEYSLTYDQIQIRYTDEDFRPTIEDNHIKDLFLEYHKKNAILCLVHKDLNLKLRNIDKSSTLGEQVISNFKRTHQAV